MTRNRGNWIWGVAYLLMMGLIVLTLVNYRQQVMHDLVTPQARQNWEKVREAARESQHGRGPVRRQIPPSDEPPALVLMRDNFPVLVAGGLIFGTALFVTLVIVVKGVFWRRGDAKPAPGDLLT